MRSEIVKLPNKPSYEYAYELLDTPEKKPILLQELFHLLEVAGLLESGPKRHFRQQSRLLTQLTVHHEKFTIVSSEGKTFVSLRKWAPVFLKPQRIKSQGYTSKTELEPAQLSVQNVLEESERIPSIFTHALTKHEITHGYFTVESSFFGFFKTHTGSEYFPINIYCYGGYSFDGWVHSKYSSVNSARLKDFFLGNDLFPGDIITTRKDNKDPIGIFLATQWQRNLDKYLRETNWEELAKSLKNSSQLSVKDIIYTYLLTQNQPKSSADIISVVKDARPEVAESSVIATLSASNLFRRTPDKQMWGLSVWPQTQKVLFAVGKEKEDAAAKDKKVSGVSNPVYLLSLIHKKDYVYRILKSESRPLSVSQIAGKIAKTLAISPQEILKLSFIDTNDRRIKRLENGSFALREREEEKIAEDTTSQEIREALKPTQVVRDDIIRVAKVLTAAAIILTILIRLIL